MHGRIQYFNSEKRFGFIRIHPDTADVYFDGQHVIGKPVKWGDRVSFWLDNTLVVQNGGRAATYREEDGQRALAKAEIAVRVALGRGNARTTVWTCDLSHKYVSINADYRS